MRKILGMFFLLTLSASVVLAQEVIKAKDAYKYIGKRVTIIGKIKFMAGPGYTSSIFYSLVTDSAEIGIGVTVPIKVWRKSKVLNTNKEGKTMKVTGLIKLNGEPYTEVENLSDVQILE